MIVTSPLGKYSQIVAVIVSLAIVLAWLANTLLIHAPNVAALDTAFTLTLGAIFGSFATVNGLKAPVMAAHARLDAMHAPTGQQAEAMAATGTTVNDTEAQG